MMMKMMMKRRRKRWGAEIRGRKGLLYKIGYLCVIMWNVVLSNACAWASANRGASSLDILTIDFISSQCDYVFGKRVLTYCKNREDLDYHQINVFLLVLENYIFEKKTTSPFQKYIVFHGYFEGIHGAVTCKYLIFPRFSCTLVPFSLIRNHVTDRLILYS